MQERAKKLRAIMDRLGLSEAQVAKKVGVSQASVWRALNKESVRPGAANDTALAPSPTERALALHQSGPVPRPDARREPAEARGLARRQLAGMARGCRASGLGGIGRWRTCRGCWVRTCSQESDRLALRSMEVREAPSWTLGRLALIFLGRRRFSVQQRLPEKRLPAVQKSGF